MQNSTNIVFLAIQMSIFGGYKKTTEDDIIQAGGALPKGDLITKGGKHIFPLKKLADFHNNKKQLLRDLSGYSVKSVGGAMAFNQDDLAEVEKLVLDAKAQFEADLQLFINDYDQNMSDFIASQSTQGLQEIVKKSALTSSQAAERFGFSYDMYVPTPIGTGSTIESMASNLASRLYEEIAKESYFLWDKSIMPADSSGVRHLKQFGQKTKRPIAAAASKLQKLAFLDSNITNSIKFINDVLASTQQQGYLEDTPDNYGAKRFVKLVELMSDAEKFRATATVQFADLESIDTVLGVPLNRGSMFAEPVEELESESVISSSDSPVTVLAAETLVVKEVPVATVVKKVNRFAHF